MVQYKLINEIKIQNGANDNPAFHDRSFRNCKRFSAI